MVERKQRARRVGATGPQGGARALAAEEADLFDLGGLETTTGYVMRRAQMAIFGDFLARFAELDLKPAQFATLQLIAANPGQNQSAIGAALGILRPNFVALLDELERRGLARREKSDADRRSHAVTLTDAGQSLLQRARAAQAAQEQRIREILGEEARESLIALSTRLWRGLS
ncbi:DNA-binding MarR family transcriptional regulator [Rhodoblastus sphagnicola]|uniref:MarR family winged helix-turn-helix transcriptional regulator n=1 Tax=Rhodoblastus sphagnicola TaxID=333368 RepID=UPI001304F0E3|nr:MarR family transcriptional regulator [Rhodoblastus sphagnicola]MBB4197644.1 DNA-binding MarR family transcriptional regulator [Rhodoblastus sphagnicola]